MTKIKAVLPAAGLGTRFPPATRAMPEGMPPVADKPEVQYVVEEAVIAGNRDIAMTIGRNENAFVAPLSDDLSAERRRRLRDFAARL